MSDPLPPYLTPIPYALPTTRPPGRPGGLIALGVITIMVGGLGLIVNLLVCVFFCTSALRVHPPGPPVLPPPVPPEVVPAYNGEWIGADGLPAGRRDSIVSTVQAWPTIQHFSVDRAAMLDRLLSDAGQRVFSKADFRIISIDQLPHGPDGGSEFGSHVLTTTGGVVTINNASVFFAPADGSPGCRVVGNCFVGFDRSVGWSSVVVTPTLNNTLRSISQVTAQQGTAISRLMRAEPIQLPRSNQWQFSGIDPVEVNSVQEHVLQITTTGNVHSWVLPDGRAVAVASYPAGLFPDGTPRTPPPTPYTNPIGDPQYLYALAAEAVVAMLVWALLIIAAVRSFIAPWPGTIGPGRLYELFAFLKITLTLIWVVLQMLLVSSMSGTRASALWTPTQLVGMGFGVQWLTPIAILGMLGTSSMLSEFQRTDDMPVSRDAATRSKFFLSLRRAMGSPMMLVIIVIACLAAALIVFTSVLQLIDDPSFLPAACMIAGALVLVGCGKSVISALGQSCATIVMVSMILIMLATTTCPAARRSRSALKPKTVDDLVQPNDPPELRMAAQEVLDADHGYNSDITPVDKLFDMGDIGVPVIYRWFTARGSAEERVVKHAAQLWSAHPPTFTPDGKAAVIAAIPSLARLNLTDGLPNPVFTLVTLAGDDPAVRGFVAKDLGTRDVEIRQRALKWLTDLDQTGAALVDAVNKTTAVHDTASMWALSQAGPAGVARLKELARDSDSRVSTAAFNELGNLPESPDLVSFLLQIVQGHTASRKSRSRDDQSSNAAAHALAHLKPDGVRALVDGLFDGTINRQNWDAIGRTYPHIWNLVGLLDRRLRPTDPATVAADHKAVLYMTQDGDPRDKLLTAMSDPDPMFVKSLIDDFTTDGSYKFQVGPVLLHKLDGIDQDRSNGRNGPRYTPWIDPAEANPLPMFAVVTAGAPPLIASPAFQILPALFRWCWMIIAIAMAVLLLWVVPMATMRSITLSSMP